MHKQIFLLRKELNLTQENFGIRLGVGKTAISKLENGENNLTEAMTKLVCREFNVSELWLHTGEGDMFQTSFANDLDGLINRISYADKAFVKDTLTTLTTLNQSDFKLVADLVHRLKA